MELQRVVTIVESLAAETSHPPEVTQALLAAANLLKRSRPAAAGQRWSDEEDALLCHEFDGGTAVPEIARQHGRSQTAIELRLVKLGRLDADSVKVRERRAPRETPQATGNQ